MLLQSKRIMVIHRRNNVEQKSTTKTDLVLVSIVGGIFLAIYLLDGKIERERQQRYELALIELQEIGSKGTIVEIYQAREGSKPANYSHPLYLVIEGANGKRLRVKVQDDQQPVRGDEWSMTVHRSPRGESDIRLDKLLRPASLPK